VKPLILTLFALAPAVALAQAPAATSRAPNSLTRAVNSITPEDVQRRINVIAHDSMGGRDTPSPGLEKTAAYIAGEFQRVGLKPGGDHGTFLQRYGVLSRAPDTAATTLQVGGARPATLHFGADFNSTSYAPLPEQGASGPLIVLAGPSDSTNPFGGQSIAGA